MTRKAKRLIDPTIVAEAVSAAPKYAPIVDTLVRRVAVAESAKATSFDDALKRTKRRLHQMVGAYLGGKLPGAAELDALAKARTEEERRAICLRLMSFHASTRERAQDVEEIYAIAFEGLPPPDRVFDLACGLNPLARIFMPLPLTTVLACYDAHADLVAFDLAALERLGFKAIGAAHDLLAGPPPGHADVALLMKTLPCLMQADPQISRRLVESIDADVVVVTFPVASLGGGKRGMSAFYADQFERHMVGSACVLERIALPHELVFRVRKSAR